MKLPKFSPQLVYWAALCLALGVAGAWSPKPQFCDWGRYAVSLQLPLEGPHGLEVITLESCLTWEQRKAIASCDDFPNRGPSRDLDPELSSTAVERCRKQGHPRERCSQAVQRGLCR